ncbi:hypothetical protein SYNPS1DRAFT_30342, partial [Syncephalis pseudoplumigaleata]
MADELLLFCLVDGKPPKLAFSIDIPLSRTVYNLKEYIKSKDSDSFENVDACCLNLWKVSIPVNICNLQRGLLLDTINTENKEYLMPTNKLSKVFSDPPPEDTIHIIVERPLPPERHHPRQRLSIEATSAALEDIANEFFSSESFYAQYLKEFVQGKHDLPITQGAVSGLPRVDSRGAAEGREAPSLLFFDLPGPRDATRSLSILKEALDTWPGLYYIPLFGASGCGKTRTLLALLSRTWGFYFNAGTEDIGSDDIQIITDALSDYRHTYSSSDTKHNTNNMRYLTCGLLYARLLILDYCLNVPGSTDTFNCQRWMLLQAATPVFIDVFKALFRKIADLFHGESTPGYHIIDIVHNMFNHVYGQLQSRSTSRLKEFKFLLVLDEAHRLNRHPSKLFQDSSNNGGHSVIAPLLYAFRHIAYIEQSYRICVIPSETGLSRYQRELSGGFSIMKLTLREIEELEDFSLIREFPGWADEDAVPAYVNRLGQAVDAEARARLGELFQPHVIRQLYRDLRGRFGPIVATIESIIRRDDPSLCEDIIKDRINCLTTADALNDSPLCRPMAGNYCLELQRVLDRLEEKDEASEAAGVVRPSGRHLALMSTLKYAIMAYIVQGTLLILPREIAVLVEAYLARLRKMRGARYTLIDEPLVFRALDNYFRVNDSNYRAFRQAHFGPHRDEIWRGTYWEIAVPANMQAIFHGKVVPTALFAEGKPPHAIFQHRAMLAGHSNARQMVDHCDVTMRQFLDAHVHHGSACEGGVMPPFYIAKPHKSGPSIVFVVRFMSRAAAHPNGIACPVFVQLMYGQELYYDGDDDDDDARETAARAEKHAEHDIDIS